MTTAKAIVAAVVAALAAFVASVQGTENVDSLGWVGWLVIVLSAVVAGGVTYLVPNAPAGARRA